MSHFKILLVITVGLGLSMDCVSAAIKGEPALQVKLQTTDPCCFVSPSMSQPVAFRDYINKQLSEIRKIESGKTLLANVQSLLQKNNICLRFDEPVKEVALFVHGLGDDDFDQEGRPDLGKLETYGEKKCVTIQLAGKRILGSTTVFTPGNPGSEFLYKSTYLGKTKDVCVKLENQKTLSVKVREIGTAFLPPYIALAHELIHLKHFLQSIDLESTQQTDPKFITYGLALRAKNLKSFPTDYFDNGKLSQERVTSDFPESSEYFQLKEIITICKKILEKSSDVSQIKSGVRQVIDSYCWYNDLNDQSKIAEVNDIYKRLSELHLSTNHIKPPRFLQLVKTQDWPNLEERRTIAEENVLRKEAGFPIRPLYNDLMGFYAYITEAEAAATFNGVEPYNQDSYITGVKDDFADNDLRFMPLPLRLYYGTDRAINAAANKAAGDADEPLASTKTNDLKNEIKLARAWFGIREPRGNFVETPAPSANTTDAGPNAQADDSESTNTEVSSDDIEIGASDIQSNSSGIDSEILQLVDEIKDKEGLLAILQDFLENS